MNRAELFPIGDVARLFHISVSSLRHYEKLGLLQPEYIDPDTGYRYYSIRQFEPSIRFAICGHWICLFCQSWIS